MGRGGTTTRRQVKQTLNQYARAFNRSHQASLTAFKRAKLQEVQEIREIREAQNILDAFKRIIKNARACEIPALAVLHLPVPPGRISIVFDNYQACNHHYDDANIVILVTKTGAEIYWYHASINTHRGF